jgi:membrane protease YdiL (CAAX protease family)
LNLRTDRVGIAALRPPPQICFPIRLFEANVARAHTTVHTLLPIDAAVSAFLQVTLLAGVPFLGYFVYQKWRHKRSFAEIARRASLQRCAWQYLAYSVGFALAGVLLIVIWMPPLEPLTREGSALRQFVGLGFSMPAVTRAILYGVVQTAFAEELLFRGLIAGSLSRRLPLL